jgi:hypothetical protein
MGIQFRPNSKRRSVLCAKQKERYRESGGRGGKERGGKERGGRERERKKERERERERVYQVR